MTCTREEIINSIGHEVGVIRSLAGDVRADMLEWRPTPGQRSMRELLAYLTICAQIPSTFNISGNWDHAKAMSDNAESTTTLDTFDGRMKEQLKALTAMIEGTSHADLAKPSSQPWQTPITVGRGWIDLVLKPLVAYRMQLFLYLKMAGRHNLGPFDCWARTAADEA